MGLNTLKLNSVRLTMGPKPNSKGMKLPLGDSENRGLNRMNIFLFSFVILIFWRSLTTPKNENNKEFERAGWPSQRYVENPTGEKNAKRNRRNSKR